MSMLFVIVLLASSAVYAAYSSNGVFNLNADSGWKTTTTGGTKLKSQKTTDSTQFIVYTTSKTMSSYPKFRLTNSDGIARSKEISVANDGESKTGSGNTGT